jgi:hypothetical protein
MRFARAVSVFRFNLNCALLADAHAAHARVETFDDFAAANLKSSGSPPSDESNTSPFTRRPV